MKDFRKSQQGGFSIIEFLLVLTAFVIFLAAAFIGYRTLRANGEETQIGNKFKLMANGIRAYQKDFYGAAPYVACSGVSAWTTSASNNTIASCSALEQYIGSFLISGASPWTYTAYTGTTIGGGTAATTATGNATSLTVGYYVFTTEPIDNGYVQNVLNQANSLGYTCSVTSAAGGYTAPSGSSMIICTSGITNVAGQVSPNYF